MDVPGIHSVDWLIVTVIKNASSQASSREKRDWAQVSDSLIQLGWKVISLRCSSDGLICSNQSEDVEVKFNLDSKVNFY